MLITRTSMITGVTRALDLDVTEEQLFLYYEDGILIQSAFPNLTPGEREFIKTGISEEEWKELFTEENYTFLNGDFEDDQPTDMEEWEDLADAGFGTDEDYGYYGD